MAGIKTITQTSPVQKDALEILRVINLQRAKIVKKFGANKVNNMVKGLEAITKLKQSDIDNANKKGANLKLITIKAQEILQGDAVFLGASMPVKRILKQKNYTI